MIDTQHLREILAYDPETGIFTWKARPNSKICLGAKAGSDDGQGYIGIRYRGKNHKAHRLAWQYVHGAPPAGIIDHINQNKADNRIGNLRIATNSENVRNCCSRATGLHIPRDTKCPVQAYLDYCAVARARFGEQAVTGPDIYI